jgi:drug/metabolite transporter (DMT)-like permease
MNKRALRADILLLLTAGIWGFGFVAQRSGMEYTGPFAFNGIRFILGSLSLLPIILVRRKKADNSAEKPVCWKLRCKIHSFLLPSLAAGSCLFVAVIFQQFGILFTTAGNAGFITGLYVVLTPIFGIFLGRKTGTATWLGSVLTLTGLYFISVAGRPGSINPGDVIIVISALFWTVHVLLIDRLMHKPLLAASYNDFPNARRPKGGMQSGAEGEASIDPLELSAGQFAVCGIFSLLGAFLAEPFIGTAVERIDPSLLSAGLFAWQPFPALVAALKAGTVSFGMEAVIPILYGGLGSVGIAYTLQVVAQRDAPPAHATIILCFEGCFAALGGVLLIGEKVGAWTLLGFIFMLAGMLATQWEVIAKDSKSQ